MRKPRASLGASANEPRTPRPCRLSDLIASLRLVAGQDVLDDRQAKAGALLGAAGLDVDAVEALGDARNVLLGDAGAEIAEGDVDAAFGAVIGGAIDTTTVPPDWPYLQAFSSRFSNTWNSSSRSPGTSTGPSAKSARSRRPFRGRAARASRYAVERLAQIDLGRPAAGRASSPAATATGDRRSAAPCGRSGPA